jgi:hypothetical protein
MSSRIGAKIHLKNWSQGTKFSPWASFTTGGKLHPWGKLMLLKTLLRQTFFIASDPGCLKVEK